MTSSSCRSTHVADSLSLKTKMRNIVSCVGDHAVKVSDYSCQAYGGGACDSISDLDGCVERSVTCAYKANLSSKELLIVLIWSTSTALSVTVDRFPPRDRVWAPDPEKTQVLQSKMGYVSFVFGGSSISLDWNLNSARFVCGPEPESGFRVTVFADGEVVLNLGDASGDRIKVVPAAEFSMLSRRERVVVRDSCTMRARLREGGAEHEIAIKCRVGDEHESELSVWIDRKKVVHERKPEWNFRGNQMAFVGDSPVDVMWDALGWWGGGNSWGSAAFLFRSRSSLDTTLWLDEEMVQKQPCFSLLIQALRS